MVSVPPTASAISRITSVVAVGLDSVQKPSHAGGSQHAPMPLITWNVICPLMIQAIFMRVLMLKMVIFFHPINLPRKVQAPILKTCTWCGLKWTGSLRIKSLWFYRRIHITRVICTVLCCCPHLTQPNPTQRRIVPIVRSNPKVHCSYRTL